MNTLKIRTLPPEWVKINLGSHRNVLPGWINTDIYPFEGVDVTADLNEAWPWQDDYATYIRAFDLVEHLRSPVHTMNEAWRVLGHGGVFEVCVPSTDGRGAFQDPTHVSYWNFNSFYYFTRKGHALLYPGFIRCDYQILWFDTEPDPQKVIWTWAFCRAIKDPGKSPRVSEAWTNALTSLDPSKRTMDGYEGDGFGTFPSLESPIKAVGGRAQR